MTGRSVSRRAPGLLAGVLALLAAGFAAAQHAPPPPRVTFPAGSPVVELPFRTEQNHILITARIDGSPPLPCMLDTGARGTVMFGDSLLRPLGLRASGTALIRGAGSGPAVRGTIVNGMTLTVGGVVMSDAMLIVLPDSSLAAAPLRHRLVIGHGLFESAVVEIDWQAGRLRLHDPARFHYDGAGASLPLTFDRMGMAYTTARIAFDDGAPFEVKLVVDTGASHALSLEPATDRRIRAPADAPRIRIGRGAGGDIYGARGRTPRVEIAGMTLRDVPTDFPDASLGMDDPAGRQGSLGSGLLRRFRVFLDFGHARMILEPLALTGAPSADPGR